MRKIIVSLMMILLLVGCGNTEDVAKPEIPETDVDPVEKKIVASMPADQAEIDWIFDVKDIHEVVDHSDVFIKVIIDEVEELGFYIGDNLVPYTKVKINLIQTLKGDVEVGDQEFLVVGGLVTLEDALKHTDQDSAKVMGWTTIKNPDSVYVDYRPFNTSLNVGQEYYLALNQAEDGTLILGSNEFGILQGSMINTEDEYIVLLRNSIDDEQVTVKFKK